MTDRRQLSGTVGGDPKASCLIFFHIAHFAFTLLAIYI